MFFQKVYIGNITDESFTKKYNDGVG